jgi:hypothetical protein
MQFGKTLVGAIIGAILGIGLLIAVYLMFGIDKMWMAIPVALLTGLGVRMVAATSGHASYLRGAITVVLAMAAYLGGLAITRAVANHRAETVSKANPPRAAKEEPGEPGDAKSEESGAEAPPVNAPPVAPMNPDLTMRRSAVPSQAFSTWDFISLAVAALVAYELGRGSGGVLKDSMGAGPSEPALGGTHPDA